LALVLGFFFGSWSAFFKNRRPFLEKSLSLFSLFGLCLPNFLLAAGLQYFFAVKLNLLPLSGFESFAHTLLPAFSLALAPAAFIAKLLKTGLVEIFASDYIKLARCKGLGSWQIFWRHALKNALLPVIAYLGPLTAYILTGSFVIEKSFSLPGLGSWLIMSISNRDYPVILGLSVFFTPFFFLWSFCRIWPQP
jgi:oligopeptide transport system permease protein